jgi:hypothetical protein
VYVGVTSKTIEERWETFQKDVKKYLLKSERARKKKFAPGTLYCDYVEFGNDVWEHATLETHENPIKALLAERNWVNKLNSLKSTGHGYNQTPGGDVFLNGATIISVDDLFVYVDNARGRA